MSYSVQTANRRVEKEIARLPDKTRKAIVGAIRALAETPRPHGIIQVEPNVYRLRVGDYRIIYKVYDDRELVRIGRVRRRNEGTYDGLSGLFSD